MISKINRLINNNFSEDDSIKLIIFKPHFFRNKVLKLKIEWIYNAVKSSYKLGEVNMLRRNNTIR